MGTPDYADEILKKLISDNRFDVVSVFTQPDKKVGRKQVITPPIVKITALDNGIAVYQPEVLRAEENVQILKSCNPDFIVVAAYGQILSREILGLAPCINLHASLLPKYRGASPIQASILEGDELTGVTSMLMAEGLDSGDILGFVYVDPNDKNAGELFDELAEEAGMITIDTLLNFKNIKPLPQNHCDFNYAKKISKQDGLVNFQDLNTLYRKYLGYTPWPGVFLESGVKLLKIEPEFDEKQYKEAEILEIAKDYITVGCLVGKCKIMTLQPSSKKPMDATSYIRGKRLEIGDYLS